MPTQTKSVIQKVDLTWLIQFSVCNGIGMCKMGYLSFLNAWLYLLSKRIRTLRNINQILDLIIISWLRSFFGKSQAREIDSKSLARQWNKHLFLNKLCDFLTQAFFFCFFVFKLLFKLNTKKLRNNAWYLNVNLDIKLFLVSPTPENTIFRLLRAILSDIIWDRKHIHPNTAL